MKVDALYYSPQHVYYGHHGQPSGSSPLVCCEHLDCVAGRGISGDRFFDYKPDYKGQITFFSAEIFAALCLAIGAVNTAPSAVRRNVLVHGVDLNNLVGCAFELQGIRFLGVEECRPCYWMNEAVGPGAESWLQGRGGLRAKILSDGRLTLRSDEADLRMMATTQRPA